MRVCVVCCTVGNVKRFWNERGLEERERQVRVAAAEILFRKINVGV